MSRIASGFWDTSTAKTFPVNVMSSARHPVPRMTKVSRFALKLHSTSDLETLPPFASAAMGFRSPATTVAIFEIQADSSPESSPGAG